MRNLARGEASFALAPKARPRRRLDRLVRNLVDGVGACHGMSLAVLAWAVLSQDGIGSDHPGNVHVEGEVVRLSVPDTWSGWRAVDVEGRVVGAGMAQEDTADLGMLPTGYYELRQKDGPARVTAAVVARNTPVEDTPIAIDAAMSWFYPEPQQIRDACTLCRLAGVKWVRDRASWPELETARGTWAEDGRYERAMRLQHEAGLKVLQVNHISPTWASKNASRFPEDLRDVFSFCEGIARRWKGLADAIEPWNEPDIDLFGGHTGCEIASFQKAAYLGLKAGNPEQPVCGTVFAIDRAETLDEFGANDVYPYFDRYDLHHYIGLPAYSRAYGRHREVSGGRPMWTTEFNLPVHWSDETTKEPSDEELRVQAFRVGKVFAQVLHEGAEKAFYFILGDYVERNLQYGLVHHDLTPRPAYVAFAAVGRLLNGAKPIGRVDLGDDKLMAYAFNTLVDGKKRETLVAWSETKPSVIAIPQMEQAYDYLGRKLPARNEIELTRETKYLVLSPGGSNKLKITAPPEKSTWRAGKASPVVLQLIGEGDSTKSAFRLDASGELQLVAYNFGKTPVSAALRVKGARVESSSIDVAPGGREVRVIRTHALGQVTVQLDTGDLGTAIVSGRVIEAGPASTE